MTVAQVRRLCLSLMAASALAALGVVPAQQLVSAAQLQPIVSYENPPLAFEANHGQAPINVDFLARGPGYTVLLSPTEAVLALASGVVRLEIRGGARTAVASGAMPLRGKVNYFKGPAPAEWRTDVPTFGAVRYAGVYSGIDLVYYGTPQQLEYDFRVAPGGDPRAIRLAFSGVEDVTVDAAGDLVLRASGGEVRQHRPVIYQEVDGKRNEVAGRYVTHAERQIGFEVDAYDTARTLVIDPVLTYSSYLGGADTWTDIANDIAVDASGNAYVIGNVSSPDFPTTAGAFQPTLKGRGSSDVFVMKLDPSGALVYSTFLGGRFNEEGNGIAIDSDGSAYLTGWTQSDDFPLASPLQSTNPTFSTAFVTKLGADGGALAYSTYLGGGQAVGRAIAVDLFGSAHVTGHTDSAAFQTTPNAFDTTYNGTTDSHRDVFVSKLNASGSALSYSSYLGGGRTEQSLDLALDPSGNIYMTGYTFSTDFPVSSGAYQATKAGGNWDVFVTKIDPWQAGAASLVYSTYLGGYADEDGQGIAVDTSGHAFVFGHTGSPDFPVTPGAYQTLPNRGHGGAGDAFVTKFNPAGDALVYSTLLGGRHGEDQHGNTLDGAIAIDSVGNAYVTGETNSVDFPLVNPLPGTYGGNADGYVAKLDATGSTLVCSTLLGGTAADYGYGVAIDAAGNVYVAGSTHSKDFPTTPNALQPNKPDGDGGSFDGFVTKLSQFCPANLAPAADDQAVTTAEDTSIPITLSASDQEGDGLAFTVVTLPARGVLSGTAPQLTYTPAANVNGSDSFTFKANDGEADSNLATISITVTPVNDAPAAADGSATTPEDVAVGITLVAVDVDGPTIVHAIVTPPVHGTLSALEGNRVFYTPDADYNGPDSFNFTADDGQLVSNMATVSIVVTPAPDPPVLATIGDKTIAEGSLLAFTSSASDPDGETLSIGTTDLPAGAGFDPATGAFAWTPTFAQAGLYTVTFKVTDPGGLSASETIEITVTDVLRNLGPVCSAAYPSLGEIWPPNHNETRVIHVLGVTDPDNDAVNITVTRILQDEPTNTLGDGDTSIDGGGVGTAAAWVRAERGGTPRVPGNGRAYEIFFEASDPHGEACTGSVKVGVPHDQGRGRTVIDDGRRFDSTVPRGPCLNCNR